MSPPPLPDRRESEDEHRSGGLPEHQDRAALCCQRPFGAQKPWRTRNISHEHAIRQTSTSPEMRLADWGERRRVREQPC